MVQDSMIREQLFAVIMEKLSTGADRRTEALTEFFAVTGAVNQDRADAIASLVPPLLPDLYAKWVNMFLDRLFETVPFESIELLSDGSEGNNAAAVLAYIMFLESERMEKQVAKDLASYGLAHGTDDDMGDIAAQYIRSCLSRVAAEHQSSASHAEQKAKAYKKEQIQANKEMKH